MSRLANGAAALATATRLPGDDLDLARTQTIVAVRPPRDHVAGSDEASRPLDNDGNARAPPVHGNLHRRRFPLPAESARPDRSVARRRLQGQRQALAADLLPVRSGLWSRPPRRGCGAGDLAGLGRQSTEQVYDTRRRRRPRASPMLTSVRRLRHVYVLARRRDPRPRSSTRRFKRLRDRRGGTPPSAGAARPNRGHRSTRPDASLRLDRLIVGSWRTEVAQRSRLRRRHPDELSASRKPPALRRTARTRTAAFVRGTTTAPAPVAYASAVTGTAPTTCCRPPSPAYRLAAATRPAATRHTPARP